MVARQIADEYMLDAQKCFGKSELAQAAGLAHNAASLYKSVKDHEKVATTLNFMGVIYSSMGDISMSMDCYMESMDISVENGYDDVVMLINNNIGSIYQDLGKFEKAIYYFDKAVRLSKCPQHGDRSQYYTRMMTLNLNLCISYTGIDDFDNAERYLGEALAYAEIAKDTENKFFIDITQAQLLWKMGNEDEVREHVDELVEGAIENISVSDYVLEVLSLCSLFMEMGEFKAWKKVIVAYEKYATDTENVFFKKTCVEMWMKYERAIGDTEAYNRLCVYYANLSIEQENLHIQRMSDTIDLKLQLREKEKERRNAIRMNYQDMLTGMGNKYQMSSDFEKVVKKRANNGGITVGVVDIDYFKSFNKNSGLTTGDDAIRTVARVIDDNIKGKGKAYHFYGDEFYIILEETDQTIIEAIAQKIKHDVASSGILHPTSQIGDYLTVTQAFVIKEDVKVPDEFSDVFKAADDVLMAQKKNHRDSYNIV